MGIPILSEIEKLINEHGSAVILKERLALASDQYKALETKLSNANGRLEQLEAQNQDLRTELEHARGQIRLLEQSRKEPHVQRIEELREKFLQLLTLHPEITSKQLATAIGKNIELITFHLTEMEKQGLVHGSYCVGGDTEWSIAQGGRAYLVRHGLLA